MRCKVGDLVVVSGCSDLEYSQNLGRFGIIEGPASRFVSGAPEGTWGVKPQHTFVGRNLCTGKVSDVAKVCFMLDTSLTPIRPGDLVEDTETEKQLEHS